MKDFQSFTPRLWAWWRWRDSNSWPPACKAGALPTELHPHVTFKNLLQSFLCYKQSFFLFIFFGKSQRTDFLLLERRWSSRTFRYGYLVTTSPQLLTLPSTAASNWFAHRLRVLPTPMVWRAVCTRPGNAFTATFWFAITSNSNFMYSSCRVQSELGQTLWVSLQIALSLPSVSAIVARV